MMIVDKVLLEEVAKRKTHIISTGMKFIRYRKLLKYFRTMEHHLN